MNISLSFFFFSENMLVVNARGRALIMTVDERTPFLLAREADGLERHTCLVLHHSSSLLMHAG